MKKFGIIVLTLLFCFSVLILVVRSPWGRDKAKNLLENAVETSGLQVQIGQIEGTLPNRVFLKQVEIEANGYDFKIQTVEAQLSLFRLLKKEIAFTYLNADGIAWTKVEKPTPTLFSKSGSSSFSLSVKHFHLANVEVPDVGIAEFDGNFRYGKGKGLFYATVKRPEFPDSSARLRAVVKQDGTALVRGEVNTPTLRFIPISEKIDGSLKLTFFAKILKKNVDGNFRAAFFPRNVPALLERNWSLAGQFDSSHFKNVLIKSDLLTAKAKGTFDSDFHLQQGTLQVQSDTLLSKLEPALKGRLFAHFNLQEPNKGRLMFQIPSLSVKGLEADNVKGAVDGTWENEMIKGSLALSGIYSDENWEAKTDYSWESNAPLSLPNLTLNGPLVEGKASLQVHSDKTLVGTTELSIENFQAFHLPEEIYGKLQAKAVWDAPGKQTVRLDAWLSDFYYGPIFIQTASLYSDLSDPFHTPKGNGNLEFDGIQWGSLRLDHASLETSNEGDNWPFFVFAEGKWKHPTEIQLSGLWKFQDRQFTAEVQSGKGILYNHPFALRSPLIFEKSPTLFQIKDLQLDVGGGSLFAYVDHKDAKTDARVHAEKIPLDLISLNPLETAIGGVLTLEASATEERGKLKGNFNASVDEMQVESSNLKAKGAFHGEFDADRLDLKGDLTAREAPLLTVEASLPIHLSIWPFKAELLATHRANGRFAFDGPVENLLDFFDLGTHRLEGECDCNFHFSNTITRPLVDGYCHFENGLYQNYYTGTELRDIQADFLAEGQTIYLKSLTAKDSPLNGNFTATGEIHLREKFPFRFETDFSRFSIVQIDLVTAEATGKLRIDGNLDSAIAKGNIHVTESQLSIPDHVARPLPNLQVVYRNPSRPILPVESGPIPYPLYLDIHVAAPQNIFIGGRGLDSEWKGEFHIGGTYTAIAAKGKLELMHGEFNFSSRSFKLTEGSLSLSGKEHEMPYLNIAGTLEQRGVSIIARLKGPLDSPQITFQSIPPLPLSSIMSHLLFGQDISEISGFQAFQLATSLAAIAGEGPDIMESTRRSLGVDRLRVITDPESEDGNTIALQVGKYVSKGVLVSVSQGTEESSTNASVEVEIKDNFSFQIESDQKQEQGIFTIKWLLNY